MIKYVSGDIFESKCQVILITVNCGGVMGAGIAKTCKERFPATFQQYKAKCQQRIYQPGEPRLVNVDRPLLLFPTKDHWSRPSEYEWIQEGLQRIARNADKFDSIAIPPLGCGHGGLDWQRVKALIEEELGHLDNHIEVYEPKQRGEWKTKTLRHDKEMIHSKIYYE